MLTSEHQPLGQRLRTLRERAGLTLEEAAERVGVHANTIGRLERGETQRAKAELLFQLATAYGLTPNELLSELNFEGVRTGIPSMVREGGPDDVREGDYGGFTPNPRYRAEIPPRAYEIGLSYLARLQRAGVGRDEIEEAERLLFDSRYAKLNKRDRTELSEEDHILLIEAGWEIIREVLSWQGIRP